MTRKYKYMPEDFNDIFPVNEDLNDFYNAWEKYKSSKSFEDKFEISNCGDYLNLSLKHAVEGNQITKEHKDNIIKYLEDLINDRL